MKELQVQEFINRLASDEPTPGGGAAAAIAAGMGVGAIIMAMKFSTNKKMTEQENEHLLATITKYEASKEHFIELIDRDAIDFGPLSEAYKMPRGTEEEKALRQEKVEEGLVIASQPPIELLDEAVEIIESVETIIPLVKKVIISDVGVGLQLLRSAIMASSLNLYINGGQMTDKAKKNDYFAKADRIVASSTVKIDELYAQVKEVLYPQN